MLRSTLLLSSGLLLLAVAVGCGGCRSDVDLSGGASPTNGGSAGEKMTGLIDIDGSSTVFTLTAGA